MLPEVQIRDPPPPPGSEAVLRSLLLNEDFPPKYCSEWRCVREYAEAGLEAGTHAQARAHCKLQVVGVEH